MNTLRQYLIFLVMLLATSHAAFAQADANTNRKFRPRVVPNTAFAEGEKLKYLTHYGFVNGGEAIVELKRETLSGRQVYHAKALGRTVGITDVFYNVSDVYESWFDVSTNLPLKAIRSIKEGNYKKYDEITYYHERDTIYSSRTKQYKRVEGGALDVISAFYFGRRGAFANLKPGEVLQFRTFFDDRILNLVVKFRGKDEISTKIGKFRCLKFNPVVETGGVFKTENDVTFWVSDDKNFIPLRIQMELAVGSFKTDLVEYTGLKYPLPIIK